MRWKALRPMQNLTIKFFIGSMMEYVVLAASMSPSSGLMTMTEPEHLRAIARDCALLHQRGVFPRHIQEQIKRMERDFIRRAYAVEQMAMKDSQLSP